MRGFSLILVGAVHVFRHGHACQAFAQVLPDVGAGLLAVNWEHMRRLSDASDQSGIR
jgi:hypothetical protein